MLFIPARWFRSVSGRPKRKIIVHSMEAPNKPGTAEAVGKFFQSLPIDRQASAHVGCDLYQRVGYVNDKDVAYAAPGANHDGLSVELTGYARYRHGEWTQPEMMLMLQQAALQIREWSELYGIPLRFLTASDLRRDPNASGVTTHHEVSQAFRKSNHWDPGPGFPIGTLLTMAASAIPLSEGEEPLAAYLHCDCPTGGYWLIKPTDGGVFAFDGAPPFEGLPKARIQLAAPIVDAAPYEVDGEVEGLWLLGADGGIFTLGDAPFIDSYVAHPELHQGERDFIAVDQYGDGYVVLAVERGSDPPRMNPYHFTRSH